MDLEEAVKILNECTREESRDHAFGDAEVYWMKGGTEIAFGYFGGPNSGVSIGGVSFEGEDARKLRNCGFEGKIGRNDETGPDIFNEGQIMPGLTKEAVRRELTEN